MVPEVVLAAQTIDHCRGGSFNLHGGLEAFLAAYGSAVVGDLPFSVDLVYQAIAKAAACTTTDSMAARCAIMDTVPSLQWNIRECVAASAVGTAA